MDPLRELVANIGLDIDEYLACVEYYKKPNPKYFNFVLNKMGLLNIFLYKNIIFEGKTNFCIEMVDGTLITLKNKFIAEKNSLTRAALIFLICKVYFTDDIAINLRLRVTLDDWQHFKDFLNEIKNDPVYDDVRLMVYHLFTENFFRFTIKNKSLALDYGTPENEQKDNFDFTSVAIFWKEIDEEILKLTSIDIAELKELSRLRRIAMKPYENILPEEDMISDVLSEFDEFKETIDKFKQKDSQKVSRKEVLQVCRDFLKTPGATSMSKNAESGAESDLETLLTDKQKDKKTKSKKSPEKSRHMGCSSSEEESDKQSKLRSKAYTSQKMLKTISIFDNPDRLRKCYE